MIRVVILTATVHGKIFALPRWSFYLLTDWCFGELIFLNISEESFLFKTRLSTGANVHAWMDWIRTSPRGRPDAMTYIQRLNSLTTSTVRIGGTVIVQSMYYVIVFEILHPCGVIYFSGRVSSIFSVKLQ